MDVEKVLASPIAQREGWRGHFDKAFAGGLIATHSQHQRLLLAAQLDYETWRPLNELAVVDLSDDVSMVRIARQTVQRFTGHRRKFVGARAAAGRLHRRAGQTAAGSHGRRQIARRSRAGCVNRSIVRSLRYRRT